MKHAPSRHLHIAILGSGFSGLGAAIMLKQRGIHDFALFERAADVGGTWRDNSYPGCACDVESHLYSFSFAPNPSWSRLFSPQPEIFAYLRACADRFGIVPHIRFGHAITKLTWDERSARWQIETSEGAYSADFVISGLGPLCEPQYPSIPGLDSFAGKVFHSARWDHAYDLTHKRVAVIGTGASAIQFVPAIQPQVKQLTLFQRTPAWVVPRMDRPVSAVEKAVFKRFPAAQRAMRSAIYARRELLVLGLRHPRVLGVLERYARGYLAREVRDPVLRAKLTPDFRIGCKRILISKDYLRSLTQPNVDVITSGIRAVEPNAVIAADGTRHEVDAIIFGTGFKVTEMPFSHMVYGRDGLNLHDSWRGSPKAHLGSTIHGFPNFFAVLGPNTGLGHTSVVLMIEAQLQLVIEAIAHMRANQLKRIEVREDVMARSVRELDASGAGTVWTAGGCSSWYLDQTGRNSTLWPSFTFEFMGKSHFRPAEYALSEEAHAEDASAA